MERATGNKPHWTGKMTLLTHQVPSSAKMDRAQASTVCAVPCWTKSRPKDEVDEVIKTTNFPCFVAKLIGTNGFKDSMNTPVSRRSREQRGDSMLSQGRLAAPAAELDPAQVPTAGRLFGMCRNSRSCRARSGPASDAAARAAPSTASSAPPDRQTNHKKRPRRRKRPSKSHSKPTAEAVSPPGPCGVARSPTTKQEPILRVGNPPKAEIDEKVFTPPRPSVNSAIAFILSGNDDISDTDSDWDEVDAGDERSDCPLDVLVMPLLNGLFSVSVRPRATKTSDEVDGIGAVTMSPHVRDANDRWNCVYACDDEKAQQRMSKVSFGTGDILVEVHEADDEDRKGPWEQLAIDRKRFQARIASAEAVLAPVLSAQHRQRAYKSIYGVTAD